MLQTSEQHECFHSAHQRLWVTQGPAGVPTNAAEKMSERVLKAEGEPLLPHVV